MRFIVYLCISIVLILIAGKKLIKYPLPFYVGVVILSLFIPASEAGPLAGALFTLVMFAGAFPPGSILAKTFMPVRAQLSIMACFIAIAHSVHYGSQFLFKILASASGFDISTNISLIISMLLLLIMLPLFVTSFKFIRKKMNAKTWKKLQRIAYAFYGLIYAHIMAFEFPKVLSGNSHYFVNVTAYSIVFASYLLCRIFRAVFKTRKAIMVKMQIVATSFVLVATIAVSVLFYQFPTVAGAVRDEESSISVENTALEGYSYIDGTYFGEGEGNNGKIKVQVTIIGSQISDIQIVEFPDDPEYFDKEKDGNKMISDMLASQDPDVDTVSGATYSSEGLIDAVKEALSQAAQATE